LGQIAILTDLRHAAKALGFNEDFAFGAFLTADLLTASS
jgi:hypothetical protein